MRQEMRWERHFVPFTGKLSLLILLGLFIGLVGGWQIVDGTIDYNRIDPREPFSARLVRKECVREAPFPVHRFHVCRCSDGRFFDYRVYKAEFESYETGDTLRLFLTRNGSKIISEYNVREMAIRTVGGIDIDLYLLPAAAFLLAALVSIWLLYRCKRYMNELG